MSRGIQRNLEPAVERAVFIWWILLIFGVLWIILPRAANLASKQQLLFQVLEPPSACVCQETLWQKKRFVCCSEVVLQPREVWHLCWYWYCPPHLRDKVYILFIFGDIRKNTPQIWPMKDIWTSGVDCQQLNFYSVTWPLYHAVKLIVTSLV